MQEREIEKENSIATSDKEIRKREEQRRIVELFFFFEIFD